MGGAYREADVVVARSGAMSCAEITAMGLPSLLVPYPWAADDHQRRNAEILVEGGAARMVLDRDLDGAWLADGLTALLDAWGTRGDGGARPGAGPAGRRRARRSGLFGHPARSTDLKMVGCFCKCFASWLGRLGGPGGRCVRCTE